MTNEMKPFWDKKKVLALLILFLTISLIIVCRESRLETIPTTKAQSQFALASWEEYDEYGQGIIGLKFWENSTGEWLPAPYYTHYYPDYHEELGQFYYVNPDIPADYLYNLTAGTALKMRVDSKLNGTLTGATDVTDGQNYLRHSVTVTSVGSVIFSQQNFTYSDSGDIQAPMYYYEYEVILNFIAQQGQYYTVTVTYEVFY